MTEQQSTGTPVPVTRSRARGGGEGARERSEPGSSPGATTDGDRMMDLEARLARLERVPGLRERGRGLMDRVVPRDASQHFRNAGREQLLGIRSIVDFWITRIDDAEGRAGSPARRESIEIE